MKGKADHEPLLNPPLLNGDEHPYHHGENSENL